MNNNNTEQQSTVTVYGDGVVLHELIVDGMPKIETGDTYSRGSDTHIYDGSGQLVAIINSISFSHITITKKEQS